MAGAVSDVLRRFLPAFLRAHHGTLNRAQRRAVWAITRCRTPDMGGHLCGCGACGARQFHYHSCNHRSCPQCGRSDTAQWVERQLSKRVGAPYFMVTFTLPEELRGLFFSPAAKEIYQLLFAAAAAALSATLADPRWLGAATCGFTMVLHTWNQRLLFHPHLHCIVPGAGLDAAGKVVTVNNANFLVPQPALRRAFRRHFRDRLVGLAKDHSLPAVDPAVWDKEWGVHLQPFGDGQAAIKYLGAYVCRTAIGDSRILAADDDTVTFRWTDRANHNAQRTGTLTGVEFVRRYLRHVLPCGMRAIRYYGFCHPAAKDKRQRVAFHTGRPLLVGAFEEPPAKPTALLRSCPCCGTPMAVLFRLLPPWKPGRAPPLQPSRCA
jgi:hypothetical protein